MIPIGHPIKKYTVFMSKLDLFAGEIVYKFSRGDCYKVETISRDGRYEIKILDKKITFRLSEEELNALERIKENKSTIITKGDRIVESHFKIQF